jgi:hypothetical protein
MKLIYAINEYGPHGPIPNCVGMSHNEYISHYYKTPMKVGMTYFTVSPINEILGIDYMHVHHSDLVNNIDYYSEQGTIVYNINIQHNIKYIISLYYGSGRGIWIEHIPKNIIELWTKGKCKIIISHNWADCEIDVINRIFDLFLKEFGTCRDFYIWSTSIFHPGILGILNESYRNNLIHMPMAEIWSLKKLPQYHPTKCEKDKKFIKLARRYTLDRLMSHVTFTKEDLNKYGFISIPAESTSTSLPLNDYIKHTYKNEEWIKIIDEIDLQPSVLDQSALTDRNRSTYTGSWMGFANKENLAEYYDRSYFSIVSESRFDEATNMKTGFFYTEKIIRAMLYEHPFILQSVPHALEHIKIAGYKTFDKFWDEDYDTITNHSHRVYRITEIVKDICLNKDLENMSKEWTDIITHNKNQVLTRVEEFKNYLEGLKNEKSISNGT